VAPNSIRSLALERLLQEVSDGELSEDAALIVHEQITRMKIRLLGDRVSRRMAWNMAREHGWTILEAEYLAVAKLQSDAFVTVDADFAAKAAGVVTLAPLTDLFH
jgi:predicted nucleic acid-binding protein